MPVNYIKIIKQCKFIAKPNTPFIEGTQAILDTKAVFPMYRTPNDKINSLTGIFTGYTNEKYYEEYSDNPPTLEEEVCSFNQFLIYDKLDTEISNLTIKDAIKLYKNNN